MSEPSAVHHLRVRIGAVTYLNARPLTFTLPRWAPQAQLVADFPSRLADALAAGQLDVALIPSIEYFRRSGYRIVSDACVACHGPVRSVKLYSHVPVAQIRSLAIDEGSRTSAVLTQILLKERFALTPQLEPLPLGVAAEDARADAVMLVGDRGILGPREPFPFAWDLGEEWVRWTGLPFVFAMWIGRSGVGLAGLSDALAAARDEGIARLDEIARTEAPILGIPEHECLTYLRDHLEFRFGPRQQEGLRRFYQLAVKHQFAPPGVDLVFYDAQPVGNRR